MLICSIKHFFPIFYYQNQKGTSNKFCPRNIFVTMIPFTIIIKKEQPKIYNHSTYTLLIYYKKFFTFFFTVYKNEQKDSKFQRQKNRKK